MDLCSFHLIVVENSIELEKFVLTKITTKS